MSMKTSTEREVAGEVERQLAVLLAGSPALSELPIAPLRGLADLVRLELAVRRFAEIHRSKRSKRLIRSLTTILGTARVRLREATVFRGLGAHAHQISFHDTQPAA
jgi:hypothetical protein